MRQLIEKNYFINDFFRRTFLKKQNTQVQGWIDRLSQIDSIQDIPQFRKQMTEMPLFQNTLFSVKRSFGESLLYGHLHAICEYAGLSQQEKQYFPIMEHGVNFWQSLTYVPFPRVCQGDYLFEDWHEKNPGIPIYAIGPYISYAKDYYTPEKTIELKKQLGKTVLIVPAHTHEMAKQEYDMQSFVSQIVKRYAEDYDTVMVLAYWADFKYPLYDYFEQSGAKLVSAGFRGDPNFISRLKTILSLSDLIVGNDAGTFIGYGVALGKQVVLLENDIKYNLGDMSVSKREKENYLRNIGEIYDAFGEQSDQNPEKQRQLCEKFWGLGYTKTPDEIRDLMDANRYILKHSHGQLSRIAQAAKESMRCDSLSARQHEMIKKSI